MTNEDERTQSTNEMMAEDAKRSGLECEIDGAKDIINQSIIIAGCIHKQVRRWSYVTKKGLGDQICRSATSVASNYSEGMGRSENQKMQFFGIAQGSAQECLAQLEIALSSGLVNKGFARRHRVKLRAIICHIVKERYELEDIGGTEYDEIVQLYNGHKKSGSADDGVRNGDEQQ